MRVKLIFVNGTSFQCGKDTAASLMSKKILDLNPEAKSFRMAFSYKLKQLVSSLTGVQLDLIHDENYSTWYYDFTKEQKEQYLPLWNMTLGRMLQVFATEALRDNFDEDIWVKALAQTISTSIFLDKSDQYVFIPDWRFPNEALLSRYIKSIVGRENIANLNLRIETCYVKVHRDLPEDQLKGRDMKHSSENSLKDVFASIIDNNGTLEQLTDRCFKYARNEIYPSTNSAN